MIGLFVWVAVGVGLAVGLPFGIAKQERKAERICQCTCGFIHAEPQDLPAPEPGEVWGDHTAWFGSRVLVCHISEARQHEIQDTAIANWDRRLEAASLPRTTPGLIGR